MRSGCPWRLVPSDLPPWGTIYRWFAAWRDDGRFERINRALVTADRERVGRDASPRPHHRQPRASRPPRPAARVVTMRARRSTGASVNALVDTDGRGLVIEPHPASVQDRDGGGPLLSLSRRSFPSSSASSPMPATLASASPAPPRSPSRSCARPRSNRLRRPAATLGCRALLRLDRAATIASARAFLYAASVMLLVRRLARSV
jgi:hypothetical protein